MYPARPPSYALAFYSHRSSCILTAVGSRCTACTQPADVFFFSVVCFRTAPNKPFFFFFFFFLLFLFFLSALRLEPDVRGTFFFCVLSCLVCFSFSAPTPLHGTVVCTQPTTYFCLLFFLEHRRCPAAHELHYRVPKRPFFLLYSDLFCFFFLDAAAADTAVAMQRPTTERPYASAGTTSGAATARTATTEGTVGKASPSTLARWKATGNGDARHWKKGERRTCSSFFSCIFSACDV